MSVFGLGMPPPPPKRRVHKWEYCTVYHEIDDQELNKYGEEGWELMVAVADSFGRISRYLFKRPLS